MLSSAAEQRKWSYVHDLSKHTEKKKKPSFVVQFDLQPIIEYNVRKILEKEKKSQPVILAKRHKAVQSHWAKGIRRKVTDLKEYDGSCKPGEQLECQAGFLHPTWGKQEAGLLELRGMCGMLPEMGGWPWRALRGRCSSTRYQPIAAEHLYH